MTAFARAVEGRLLRVSIVLHSFDRGGSGRVAGYLAQGFARRGLDVELLVVCRGGETEQAVTALVDGAAPIRFLGPLRGPRAMDLACGLPRLVGALRERRPDVVIAAANNVALVSSAAVRLARLDGATLFLKTTNPIAGSRHRGLAASLRLLTYGWTFKRSDGVWTLSPEETHAMTAAFPAHAHLFRDVHNPYVTHEMLARAAPQPVGRRRRIIAVARLVPQKRLDRLLRAFAEVEPSDVDLLILGEGEDRPLLEAIAEQTGRRDRIFMPGQSSEVAAALHASDLFVLTSAYEGLPAVVLESLAAGCPVLSTDCFPAARSLMERAPGCGIIEDVSPGALARQITACLARPRPDDLRSIAQPFSVANGVRSHLQALEYGRGSLSSPATLAGNRFSVGGTANLMSLLQGERT